MVSPNVTFDTQNILRGGLSGFQARLLSDFAASGKEIVTLRDFVRAGVKRSAVKMLVSRLAKKKWLIRIAHGRYLISPLAAGKESHWTTHEFVLATSVVSPCYVSYWNALNFYGWTEQLPQMVTLASTKRRRETQVQMVRVRVATVSKKKFFGFETIELTGCKVDIASREKAIVDCLDRPDLCGGVSEIAKALEAAKEELNLQLLVEYAKKMGNSAILRRLGFLTEKLGIKLEGINEKFKGYVWLDPSTWKKKVVYNSKWGLAINVNDIDLFYWREMK